MKKLTSKLLALMLTLAALAAFLTVSCSAATEDRMVSPNNTFGVTGATHDSVVEKDLKMPMPVPYAKAVAVRMSSGDIATVSFGTVVERSVAYLDDRQAVVNGEEIAIR